MSKEEWEHDFVDIPQGKMFAVLNTKGKEGWQLVCLDPYTKGRFIIKKRLK